MEIEEEFKEIIDDTEEAIENIQKDTRPKRRIIQAWYSKLNDIVQANTIAFYFIIVVGVIGLYINPTLPTISKMETVEQVKEAIKVPKVKAGVFYTIDLSKMYTDSSKTVADGYRVYYRDKEKNATMWFTLEEPINKLKYNKIHYPKYLEEQALLEAKEVK